MDLNRLIFAIIIVLHANGLLAHRKILTKQITELMKRIATKFQQSKKGLFLTLCFFEKKDVQDTS